MVDVMKSPKSPFDALFGGGDARVGTGAGGPRASGGAAMAYVPL